MEYLVKLNYNKFITLENKIKTEKHQNFIEKFYFLLHNSIFLQMAFMVSILTVIIVIVHLRFKKAYKEKLEKIIVIMEKQEQYSGEVKNKYGKFSFLKFF